MKKYLIVLLTIFSISTFAQVKFEERLEIELTGEFSLGAITTCGDKGFIVHRLEKANKKEEIRSYDFYNTKLKKEISKSITLSKKFYRTQICSTETAIHSLYKTSKGQYKLVSVRTPDLKIIEVEGEFPKGAVVREMLIVGKMAYVAVYVKKAPFLFSINWATGTKKLIPINIQGYQAKYLWIENFQALPDQNEVVLFIKAKYKKEREVYTMILDDMGLEKDKFKLTQTIDANITSVSATKIDKSSYLFTGTYSSKTTETSEGMYVCQASNGKVQFIKFHSFVDMPGFFDYLSEKKQAKIEKKATRAEKKGKKLVINYRTANHNVRILNGQYVVVSEAYYPTYRYRTRTDANGNTTTEKIFDGYQYTHAVVASFDQGGKLIWNNIFKLDPGYKPMSVIRFIRIKEVSDLSVDLVFASRNSIVSKSFDDRGNVVAERDQEIIETNHEGDKTKRSSSTLQYWYGNYFLAYGYQKIKNTQNKSVDRKRKVYFINKIRY